MRILALTWACDSGDISEPLTSYSWIKNLAAHGHSVDLLAVSRPDRYGCVRMQQKEQCAKVYEWKDIWVPRSLERFRAAAKPGYPIYWIRARLFVRKLVAEEKYDIVHHLSPFAWRYPSPAFDLGVPLVRGPVAGGLSTPSCLASEVDQISPWYMKLRRTDAVRRRFDPVLRASYRCAATTMIGAPYVGGILPDVGSRSVVVESGHGLDSISVEKSERQVEFADGLRLLYVGRLVRTKGLREALEAIARSRCSSRIVFDVIGDGPECEPCRQIAENLGIVSQVRFRGRLKRADVQSYYRRADLFVCPSFREPSGAVFLEAMAAGVPVVCADYGGPSYIVSKDAGWKVPVREHESFVQGIADSIDEAASPESLREKSRGALDRARYFQWSEKMSRVERIYQAAVKE